MPEKRKKIHYEAEGSMNQDEDWWTLIVDDAGQTSVEHQWHHMNPYKGKTTSEGTKVYSLADFEKSENGQRLKDHLAKTIAEIGNA